MARQLLIENCGFHRLEVVPSELREAKVVVEGRTVGQPILLEVKGPMTVIGVKNANGRVYSLKEMEKAIKAMKPQLEALCVFGELDHPGRERGGETSLKEVSHIIKDLWIENRETTVVIDGKTVTGTYPTLMGHWLIRDSFRGRELSNFLEIGCAVGTSMRGFGELDEKGNVLNYALKTVDAVDDPSAGTRIIAGLTEGTDGDTQHPVLNEQQVERTLPLLGQTLKRLSEANDLSMEQVTEYAEGLIDTLQMFESLTSGEVRANVLTLKGEAETMLKSRINAFMESASINESGDEAVTPGQQSQQVPVTQPENATGDPKVKGEPNPTEEDEGDIERHPDLTGTAGKSGDNLGEGKDSDDESEDDDEDDKASSTKGDSKDVEESSYKKIALELRQRLLTAEKVITDFVGYTSKLEETIYGLRDYTLQVEDVAEDLKSMNLTYEEVVTEMREHAHGISIMVNDLRGQLAEAKTGQVDGIKVAELSVQVENSVRVIEGLRTMLSEKEAELAQVQNRKAVLSESLDHEVKGILRVYPHLRTFEGELREAKSKPELAARIQKYTRLTEAAGKIRLDLPPSLSEQTEAPKAARNSTATSMFGFHKGLR